jgi:hypothetical protein
MDQLNTQPPEDGQALEAGGIILSSVNVTDIASLPPETQLATMRQIMETLFSRVEALQQNQAVQFAGVHDRLDAVELEIPLIQEQGALRIRDLEARMSVEIDEAARIAAEEAAAGLQEDVAGRFGALMAHIEGQRKELSQMRESKKLADSRLNRVVQDIERLCGNLGTHPAEEVQRPVIETVASPFRSRIAEHIRKAAVEAAPDDSNPLLKNQQPGARTQEAATAAGAAPTPASSGIRQGAPAPAASLRQPEPVSPQPLTAAPVESASKAGSAETAVPIFDDWKRQFMQEGEPLQPTLGEPRREFTAVAGSTETSVPGFDDWKRQFMRQGEPVEPTLGQPGRKLKTVPGSGGTSVPGFDDWKRQFMQEGEPLQPTLGEPGTKLKAVVCPRCYSERTRPATLTRLDGLFRLTGFNPHRCRSCAHRFYKRGAASDPVHDEDGAHTPSEEAV